MYVCLCVVMFERALRSPQERLMTLKKQSTQISLQAQQERQNFQKEKENLLLMLHKVGTPPSLERGRRLPGNRRMGAGWVLWHVVTV